MNFCYKTANVWIIVGKVFFILKIVVPLLLIVFASIELGKATVSGDEKGLNKSISSLFKRTVAAIAIFFIPTIVKVVFDMVSGFSDDLKNDAKNCINCLTDPYNSCDTSYQGDIFK